jgi:hypothetical protein
MLQSNSQAARTLLAHVKKSDPGNDAHLIMSTKNKDVFNSDAIRKMGFNPFTGKQFLAAPTEKKVESFTSNAPNFKLPAEMIELELDDEP